MNTKLSFLKSSLTAALIGLTAILNPLLAQEIDIEASTVQWTGFHLAKSYEHVGNVKIKSGEVKMKDGALVGGKVVIDMSSITNNDVEGDKNAKLVNHLKSDDFFNVEKFPEASIVIMSVDQSGDDYDVKGEVEIRGIKQPIEFTLTQSDNSLDGTLSIDRTKHEVMYGWTLENAMLSNNFELEVHVVIK